MATGFDRVAGIYRFLEHLAYGHQLERARFAHLGALRACRNILVVGDGDGRCLEEVLGAAPDAAVTSIDASRGMLAIARRRVDAAGAAARVTFVCADISTMPLPPARYDAVLTMFVLDCFRADEAAAIVRALASTVTASGLWLFADFAEPSRGWRRLHARLQTRLLYIFFRWQTGIAAHRLPPSEALIAREGFRSAAIEERRAGSIRSVLFSRRRV
ncbi:MAG: class I SAM-dependent methyltransferase [Acidobacteriota bacterium]